MGNNRLSLSTKSSQIHSHPEIKKYQLLYLQSLFNEMDILASRYFELQYSNSSTKPVAIGGRVKGVVKQKLPFGYTIDLRHGLSGVLTVDNAQKRSLKPGEEVEGVILDFDPSRNIVDLSLSDMISDGSSVSEKVIHGVYNLGALVFQLTN